MQVFNTHREMGCSNEDLVQNSYIIQQENQVQFHFVTHLCSLPFITSKKERKEQDKSSLSWFTFQTLYMFAHVFSLFVFSSHINI